VSAIHQIYCTHCTYGSSALERREGELARRTLGYSARAGSLDAAELRKAYRLFERYLYYYLPRDTPAEEKLLLTASTAPRRLVYLPEVGGLQIVGQVCYRPTDSEGRPGSYFAHVLLRDAADGGPHWPALTCLRLWQAAGWTEEDSPAIAFLLPALKSVDDMLQGKRAAVGDRVLRSFLTTPPGGAFDDPGNVIPARLRKVDAQQRQNLFSDTLDTFLDACLTRHEPLLLVAEPELAALVFYGVLRLLPEGRLRDGVSFSTFEPNPDAICTTLAATLFHDPAANLSPPDTLRVRGPVINTFTAGAAGRVSGSAAATRSDKPPVPPASRPYARAIVARLVQKDWPGVEILLGDIRACGSIDAEGLQQLVAADRQLRALLEPEPSTAPSAAAVPPPVPLMARYMRQVLCRKLATADPAALLRPLSGSTSHWALLELLAADAAEHAEARKAVEFLLKNLPGELLAQVLKLDSITSDDKLAAIARQLTAQGALPPECAWLWDHWAAGANSPAAAAVPRLVDILARLEAAALANFSRAVPPAHLAMFYCALKEAFAGQPPFWNRLTAVVAAMEPAAVVQLYGKLGPPMFAGYPAAEPALGGKLRRLLDGLHDQTAAFSGQLDLLLAGQDLLPEAADRQRALAWSQCRQAILDLGRLQSQRTGWGRASPLAQIDASGERMVEAARTAMPPELVEDDPPGTGKQRRLRAIGQCLLGESLLPATHWHHTALWKKAGWYFERGKWPGVPLASLRPKAHAQRQWRTQVAVAGAALVILLAILLTLLMTHGGATVPQNPDLPQNTEKPPELASKSAAPVAIAPSLAAEPQHVAAPAEREKEAAKIGPPAAEKQPPLAAPAAPAHIAAPPAGKPPAASLAAVAAVAPTAKNVSPAKQEPPPVAEDRWHRDARRFAEEHGGVLVEQPMSKGVAEVPDPAGQTASDFGVERPFLGPGRVGAGSETYDFGNGFQELPPVARLQEVPGLAKTLGVKSVTVVLEPSDKGYRLALHWASVPLADANAEARVAELRKRQETIKDCLLQITRTHRSPEELAEARNTLVQLLGLHPPIAPNHDEPRFAQDPQAWGDARAAYQQQYQEIFRKLPSLGQNQFILIGSQIDHVRKQAQREYNERIDAELRNRVTQIAAVLYRSTSKIELPAAAVKPSEQLAEIRGDFDQTTDDAVPAPGFIARVKVRIVAEPHGSLLPPAAWTADGVLVKCVFTPAGGQAMVKAGTAEFDAADVSPGTEKMSVRFRFFRRGIFEGEEPQLIAETPPYVLEGIRSGQQYTVTFRMSQEGLRTLRDPNTQSRPSNF
jgi:hypothetical protein